MGVEQLVRQFIDKTLPKEVWTHEAHLRVGLWHVTNFGAAEAMALLRQRIRAYNESVGGTNTDSSGYHETITQLYVKVIDEFLATANRTQSIDALAMQLIEQFGQRDLPLKYYSRELLFSTQARLNWIEPDLCSIETKCGSV